MSMQGSILNIFLYHRVLPEPSESVVSVSMFRQQLDYILARYSILTVEQLIAFLHGEYETQGPAAVITFDDGWVDNWLFATPVLQDKGVPAILALSTGFLHDGPVRTPADSDSACLFYDVAYRRALYDNDKQAFLAKGEIQAMVESGVWSIQAHGHIHARRYFRIDPGCGFFPESDDFSLRYALNGRDPFPGLPVGKLASDLACPRTRVHPDLMDSLKASPSHAADILAGFEHPLEIVENEKQYEARVTADIACCRKVIGELTGKAPALMFWPWGHYSRIALAAARKTGLEFTFSVEKGLVFCGDTKYVLPRISVSRKWSKFRRNVIVFRHPILAAIHARISPSPSGLKE